MNLVSTLFSGLPLANTQFAAFSRARPTPWLVKSTELSRCTLLYGCNLQVPSEEGRLVALHLLSWINLLTNNTDTSVTRMTLISHLSGVHDAAITLTNPLFLHLLIIPPTVHTQYLLHFNRASDKERTMSQYTINDSNNCFDATNSFNNAWNTVTDDRSQFLAWLSPLEPKLRHQDVQWRRVGNVGEWFMQTEEFRRWCNLGGEDEGDNAILFCDGDPGVGKTFIR